MLTVVECCVARKSMLPSFIIYKGTAHYMGWHSTTNDSNVVFAYSNNGWTDNELAMEWIHFGQYTKGPPIDGTAPIVL